MAILHEFGDSIKQSVVILDMDQTTHSLESRKREKAIRGRNKKNKGKPYYQWMLASSIMRSSLKD